MKVDYLEEQFDLTSLTTSGLVRSPGLHLTDLLDAAERLLGWKKISESDQSFWNLQLAGGCGFLWEDVLEAALSQRLGHRPGEVLLVNPANQSQSVICSPDGLCPDPFSEYPFAVAEHKFTWKSSNNPIENFERWLYQTKAYCAAEGTPVVVFRCLHVDGDYRTKKPVFRPVRIKYEDEEIEAAVRLLFNFYPER